jgi:hypothetical protein
MAINPSVHAQFIVSIHRSNLQFQKCPEFSLFMAWRRKTIQLLLKTKVKSVKIAKVIKRRLNFNRLIKGPILIVLIDTIGHALH